MTVKGGTSPACAACKYQRRKCSGQCPLAPYFPPDQPKIFQNAHRLFGVSNILKILKQLSPSQRMEAMRSIKYQANIRDRFPVHGCWEVICRLQQQIQQAEEELHIVNTQIAIYRQYHHHPHQVSSSAPSSQLQLGIAPTHHNAFPAFHHHQHRNDEATEVSLAAPHHFFSFNSNALIDSKDSIMNPLWAQHQPYSNNNENAKTPVTIQSQLLSSQPLHMQQATVHMEQATEVSQDYDEIAPFFDTIDDRQSYIDSKEAYDSSPESSSKETTEIIEHASENELKTAAACFSLTSVN